MEERIIVDVLLDKDMILQFSIKETDNSFQKENKARINRSIKATNTMYHWLDKQGILENVCFRYDVRTEYCKHFAFDTKDLLPYREQMETSGLEDAELAVNLIFDEERDVCDFCGGFELTGIMPTYREDLAGNVGKSFEDYRCQHRKTDVCVDVYNYRHEHGVKATIDKFWNIFSSETSTEEE